MADKVINMIRQRQAESDNVIGYTDYDLKKIEALYDITIRGQFRDLMLLAGRCDGGLIGDDPIILYRQSWSVRTQILFQQDLFVSLQDIHAYNYQNKNYMGEHGRIFCISWELETQYYYLITENNDELIYHYDENENTVECTGLTLFEYLDDGYKRYEEGKNRKQIICRGELLEIFV